MTEDAKSGEVFALIDTPSAALTRLIVCWEPYNEIMFAETIMHTHIAGTRYMKVAEQIPLLFLSEFTFHCEFTLTTVALHEVVHSVKEDDLSS